MAQTSNGIRRILSIPFIYKLFQRMMGARTIREHIASTYINSNSEVCRILDIGCGPADILDHFHDVEYYGFDINEQYVKDARSKFGKKGTFFNKQLTEEDINLLPKFNLVIMIGVLHHLNDEEVSNILSIVSTSLVKGGRLLTVDPCYTEDQNFAAKYLISKDRGLNVRNEVGYKSLVNNIFSKVNCNIKHRAWVPYTHCIMESYK